jgi:hypothetical protein
VDKPVLISRGVFVPDFLKYSVLIEFGEITNKVEVR